jgi:hypothetical protein
VGGIEEEDETFHKKKFVSMVKEEFFLFWFLEG